MSESLVWTELTRQNKVTHSLSGRTLIRDNDAVTRVETFLEEQRELDV